MSPYRFRKNVIKYGRILLFTIFILPQFYLLFAGKCIKGEFITNKNNSVRTGTSGGGYSSYQTYIYGYNVDEKDYSLEASDFYLNNFKDVQIIYNPHYPNHSAIKTASGIFFMNTLLLICSAILFEAIVSLFLKEH